MPGLFLSFIVEVPAIAQLSHRDGATQSQTKPLNPFPLTQSTESGVRGSV